MAIIKNPLTIVQTGGGTLPNYGSITYLDANDVEQTLTLATEADYMELTLGGSGSDITINGVTVNKNKITGATIADGVNYIPGGFCQGCNYLTTATIPSSVHYIGYQAFAYCDITNGSFSLDNVIRVEDSFLTGNSHFNSPISLTRVREIGSSFLYSCTSFNSSITINDNCEYIGGAFLRNCISFAQSLSLPSGINPALSSPGDRFMQECRSFTGPLVCNCPAAQMTSSSNVLSTTDSTALLYTTGVTLTGPYAQAWKDRFPDRDSSPYRKLIVGS